MHETTYKMNVTRYIDLYDTFSIKYLSIINAKTDDDRENTKSPMHPILTP
jgi:hypothetical protein